MRGGLVDARRCLSYWSIENGDPRLPSRIASRMELIFGCDRCTAVCPLNRDDGPSALEPPPRPGGDDLDLASIGGRQVQGLDAIIAGTALARTGEDVLVRNARAALAALRAKAGGDR
jgi:epoxyqueuosine reductase